MATMLTAKYKNNPKDPGKRDFLMKAPFPYVFFHSIFTTCHNFIFIHASHSRFDAVLVCNPKTDLRLTGGKK